MRSESKRTFAVVCIGLFVVSAFFFLLSEPQPRQKATRTQSKQAPRWVLAESLRTPSSPVENSASIDVLRRRTALEEPGPHPVRICDEESLTLDIDTDPEELRACALLMFSQAGPLTRDQRRLKTILENEILWRLFWNSQKSMYLVLERLKDVGGLFRDGIVGQDTEEETEKG